MTPFADEDLNELKELMRVSDNKQPPTASNSTVKALIARLEAAESCIETRCPCVDDCICDHPKRLEAWRKAKGE